MPQITGPGLDLSAFRAVDDAGDPPALVRYLDQAKLQPALQALRPRMIDQLRLTTPARLLDAGCGIGTEAIEMARTAEIDVVGVDSSRAMVEEARRRASRAGLPVTFVRADAADLPFPDHHFDASQAQTLLGHVTDPVSVVAELVRVTRPEGRVVILDLDQGSTLLDHPDRATTRKVLQTLTDGFANGWAGRQLRRLLLQAGMHDVTVELSTMDLHPAFLFQVLIPTVRRLRGYDIVDGATLDRWWSELEELAEAGLFSASITWFLAAGTAPG